MKTRYRLMILPLMFAGLCACLGILEGALAGRASSEPETISLRNLIVRGPNGNPNIILTDFAIVDDFAIETKRLTGQWTKVWMPIVPSDAPADEAPAIHAIIFSDKVESEEQLRERFERPQLRGLIDPDTAQPGLSASLTWRHKFPDMDLRKCIVIVEGKEPASTLKLVMLWLGCAACLAVAAAVWHLARKIDQANVIVAEAV